MADNQEEKLSLEQEKQRDLINLLVEKAEGSGKGITKIMTDLGKKSYYFRHVVLIPLKEDFKSFIKSQFNIDLDKAIRLADNNAPKSDYDLIATLYNDIRTLTDKAFKSLEEQIQAEKDKQALLARVKDLEAENDRLKNIK